MGKYTQQGKGIRWTQQFHICDMKFFIDEHHILPEELNQHAQQIKLVSLTFDSEKNGNQG